jgi:hypothetical protein
MVGRTVENPQGRVLHLEVEDFKSYRGHQLIGPFRDFTAIVGPNVRRRPARASLAACPQRGKR